jgi:hypothetical protein
MTLKPLRKFRSGIADRDCKDLFVGVQVEVL